MSGEFNKFKALTKELLLAVHNEIVPNTENKEALEKLQKNIQSLEHLEESDFSFDDCRALASWYDDLAIICQDPKIKIHLLEQAIKTLIDLIPQTKFTYEDWYDLALYQNTLSTNSDEKQKFDLMQSAIESLSQIPKKDFTANDWRLLALSQLYSGVYASEASQIQPFIFAGLDSYLHISNLTRPDFNAIQDGYSNLDDLYIFHTIEYSLFHFAYEVFSGDNGNPPPELPSELKSDFLSLHFAIVHPLQPRSNFLLSALIKFMRLLDLSFKQPDFPCQAVKIWLSDKSEHEKFMKKLNEAEKAHSPLSLVDTIEQSPSLLVGILKELKSLKEKNEQEDNEKLKSQESIYQSSLPMFNSTDSAQDDTKKRKREEDADNNPAKSLMETKVTPKSDLRYILNS